MFLYRTHGFRLDFYFASLFFIDLILIGFIDLEKEKIPFPLTFGGIILGIVFNMMRRNYFSPLFGFLFGWGIVYLIYFIGHKTEKKDVVGNEEMFLAGMIGAFLGLRTAIIAVFIGTLIALIYGVKMKRKMIPFAPFLACGAIIAYFFAADIIRLICPFFFIIP